MNIFRTMSKKFFPKRYRDMSAFRSLVKDPTSYLFMSGWMKSLELGCPVSADGLPLPWMNFHVIDFLKERLDKEHRVFEYGSGFSSIFFAKYVGAITSVEHDQVWYEKVQAEKLPSNLKIIFRKKDVDGDYCRSVKSVSPSDFNIVIVDGIDRINCLKVAVECLASDGVVVFDDSHMEKFKAGIDFCKEKGFRKLEFRGIKPLSSHSNQTTIFYKSQNCLGL